MAFLEVVGGIVAKEIIAWAEKKVEAIIANAMFRTNTYAKYDQQAVELIEEGKNATTIEEKDAVLDKLYEARPKFT